MEEDPDCSWTQVSKTKLFAYKIWIEVPYFNHRHNPPDLPIAGIENALQRPRERLTF